MVNGVTAFPRQEVGEEYEYEEVLDDSYEEVVIEEDGEGEVSGDYYHHQYGEEGTLEKEEKREISEDNDEQDDTLQRSFVSSRHSAGHPFDEVDIGAEQPFERTKTTANNGNVRTSRRAVDPPGSTLSESQGRVLWRGTDPEPAQIPSDDVQQESHYEHTSSRIAGVEQPIDLPKKESLEVPQTISLQQESLSSYDEGKYTIASIARPAGNDVEAPTNNALAETTTLAASDGHHQESKIDLTNDNEIYENDALKEEFEMSGFEAWWGWTECLLLMFFLLVTIVVALVVLYFILVEEEQVLD